MFGWSSAKFVCHRPLSTCPQTSFFFRGPLRCEVPPGWRDVLRWYFSFMVMRLLPWRDPYLTRSQTWDLIKTASWWVIPSPKYAKMPFFKTRLPFRRFCVEKLRPSEAIQAEMRYLRRKTHRRRGWIAASTGSASPTTPYLSTASTNRQRFRFI